MSLISISVPISGEGMVAQIMQRKEAFGAADGETTRHEGSITYFN
jgi:hypothetical protein